MGAGEDHRPLVAALGLETAAEERLVRYLDLLAAWNQRTNLTAARSPAARFDLLVRPVVPLARDVVAGRLLDIGSGNGSPGLVIAALRPDVEATLLEPRMKRWAFLREAARAMGIAVDVRRERHDEFTGPRSPTVTVRALRLPAKDLADLAASGGRVIVLGVAPDPHPDLMPESDLAGAHIYRRR